ncbi:hypothetical protein BJ973_003980 [Actinoplanes tereljensis]|uniref:Uncharacterized protein n=1 Tax=Paractinoplanes tereljensis TaxID=571912 RepID=A0A919TZA7_9ACTN|nr:hypothetical protein [Actinoplanes tereljensis]GIF25702.1 hypothetical protein Ate02nite_84320 [Actinoplanes tereljensis]
MPRFSPAGQPTPKKAVDHGQLQRGVVPESQPLPAIRGLAVKRMVVDGGALSEPLPWPPGTLITITVTGNLQAADDA